jgi:aspartyl-tRNA(Asn)/glutamyl-tRNA(Gln) amidotransferase subunit A
MDFSNYSSIQASLLNGTTSCVSVVNHFLSNIEKQKHLNAFLEVFDQEAIERAKMLDAKTGDKGKLYGMVIALKDNICYKNHKVSASSKILENYISIYSSTVVERLLSEDAIIIGRTNCDEFAMGSSNENSAYGNVLNALDNKKVPGGSSGGSAVAVQADMCMLSLGSDTGGSIRQPASFCGLVGYKPSYGLVSRYGLIAYGSSFDQIGPFSKNIEDTRLLMHVISGADEHDATMLQKNISFDKTTVNTKTKIAYIKETIYNDALEPQVREKTIALLEKLKADGHEVEAVAFDYMDYLIPAYYVLSTAEASSNLSRFDGVHYGYRSTNAQNMDQVYTKSRTEGFGKEVKNRIMLGTFVLSSGYYDAYYGKAQKLRRLLTDNINQIFSKYDYLIIPTSPTTAFEFDAKGDDPVAMYLADIFTVLSNLTGTPAISLPLFKSSENQMPIGIQLMSRKYCDASLLDFSEYFIEQYQEK